MLRDLNISVQGRRDATDPYVGRKAAQIPSGFAREAWLLNDVDISFPNRLYSLEILTLPSAGTLYLDKAGVGSLSGAPAGSYTGTQRVNKYDEGVGLVSSTTGTYSITVAEVTGAAKVNGVSVSPATATIAANASRQFSALVIGENNPPQDVTWTTTLGTISASGVLSTPDAQNAEQSGTIMATSVLDTTKSGTATFTIPARVVAVPTVTAVTVSPMGVTLAGGTTQQYTAFVAGDNGPPQGVTWTTSLGTIDANGLLTAPAAVQNVQIGAVTARSTYNPDVAGQIAFNVAAAAVPVAVTSVIVAPQNIRMPGSARIQMLALVLGTGGFSTGVTWDTTAGTITAGGMLTTPVDTNAEQTITVTARSTQDTSVTGTATITIPAYSAPAAGGLFPAMRRGARRVLRRYT